MVNNVRRLTGVGDDITFLHDQGSLTDWSGKTRCMRIKDLETKAPLTSIATGWATTIISTSRT